MHCGRKNNPRPLATFQTDTFIIGATHLPRREPSMRLETSERPLITGAGVGESQERFSIDFRTLNVKWWQAFLSPPLPEEMGADCSRTWLLRRRRLRGPPPATSPSTFYSPPTPVMSMGEREWALGRAAYILEGRKEAGRDGGYERAPPDWLTRSPRGRTAAFRRSRRFFKARASTARERAGDAAGEPGRAGRPAPPPPL